MKPDIEKLLRDAEYTMAFIEGEHGIINLLDKWLEDWISRKDNCPNCGITANVPTEGEK